MKRNYFQKEILAFTTGNFSIHREEKKYPSEPVHDFSLIWLFRIAC